MSATRTVVLLMAVATTPVLAQDSDGPTRVDIGGAPYMGPGDMGTASPSGPPTGTTAAPATAAPTPTGAPSSTPPVTSVLHTPESGDLVGRYRVLGQKGRHRTDGFLSVGLAADGSYTVQREVTCKTTGERHVLAGTGRVRRGLLLVEFGGDPPSVASTGQTDPTHAQPGDSSGGLIGGVSGIGEQQQQGPPAQQHVPTGQNAPGQGGVQGLPELQLPITISASVGQGGVNQRADIATIRDAMVRLGYLHQVEGGADGNMITRIRAYQRERAGFIWPDGRVDVDHRTIRAMNADLHSGWSAAGPLKLEGSVGQDGVNAPEDVKIIQQALVRRGYLEPGSFTPGVSDAGLIAAIRRYQRERAGFNTPDGRVDVDNRTLRALNGEEEKPSPDALPGPGGSLGEPLVDDPGATGGDVPAGDLPPIPDDLSPPDPEAPSALPDPSTLFPELPDWVALAVYLIVDGRLQGAVHDPDCGGDPKLWTMESGIKQGEDADAEVEGDLGGVRRRIAAIANKYPGLGYAFPDKRQAYTDLLFPHDEAAQADAFAKSMSSCGLFAMAVLRELGKSHRSLDTPYATQIGMAVANIANIARQDDAWVNASMKSTLDAAPPIRQGDMVIIGKVGDPAWGGTTHVLVVTGVQGDRVSSVDGGQPHIARRTRTLSRRGNELWLGGRRVQGWLNADGLD